MGANMTECSNLVCQDRPVEGAIGYEIFIETGLDISAASEVLIHYLKPDGETAGEWTAEADEREVDGETLYGAVYVTEEGDLDADGDWQLQVGVTMPAFTGRGRITKLRVLEALPEPA